MNKYLTVMLLTAALAFTACKEDVSADWKIINDQWMRVHKNDSGFVTSPSGLMYKIPYEGWDKNRRPQKGDSINVTYTGKLVDGYVFDNGTAKLLLKETIPGFQEGIKKLYEGGNCTLYIPSTLANDTISTNTRIPANSILIFDVKLNYVY